jgi:hypothetical protein
LILKLVLNAVFLMGASKIPRKQVQPAECGVEGSEGGGIISIPYLGAVVRIFSKSSGLIVGAGVT